MLNIIRDSYKSEISKDQLIDMIDYSFLVKNKEINIEIEKLTFSIFERINDFAKIENITLNVYVTSWQKLASELSDSFAANLLNVEKEIIFNNPVELLISLKELSKIEKIWVSIRLTKDLGDLITLNKAINEGTINIDNYIKRRIV